MLGRLGNGATSRDSYWGSTRRPHQPTFNDDIANAKDKQQTWLNSTIQIQINAPPGEWGPSIHKQTDQSR